MKEPEVRCSLCHSAALFLITRDTPGEPQQAMYACRTHLPVATEKIAEAYRAGSVTVYVLGAKAPAVAAGATLDAAEVLEQVRRIGAHSADRDGGRLSHFLEDQLYLRVLFAIAQGAQQPAGLAGAALMSRRYEFERTIS